LLRTEGWQCFTRIIPELELVASAEAGDTHSVDWRGAEGVVGTLGYEFVGGGIEDGIV
jgi:hypothetical protein